MIELLLKIDLSGTLFGLIAGCVVGYFIGDLGGTPDIIDRFGRDMGDVDWEDGFREVADEEDWRYYFGEDWRYYFDEDWEDEDREDWEDEDWEEDWEDEDDEEWEDGFDTVDRESTTTPSL